MISGKKIADFGRIKAKRQKSKRVNARIAVYLHRNKSQKPERETARADSNVTAITIKTTETVCAICTQKTG